ncbi:hypothetical protein [Flavobacterium sp. XS2P14]|uniref:hypothetical protein n=1 Tax=Flavobacterium sp. XS2P14 TaxID=3401735 RepID=UPI003AAD74ED
MTKEIILEEGHLSFVFVGIEAYDFLDKVVYIFESNFKFTDKKNISGWHSTVLQYSFEDIILSIGDTYETLCITLISVSNESSVEKIRKLVKFIDEILNNESP